MLPAAPFLSPRVSPLVGEVVFQRRQQEGSESPPFPFHTVERLIFEKVLEETLSQVLGSVVMGSDRD